MLKIIKYSKIWFAFSGVLVLVSITLIFSWGLKPGLDFRGGGLSDIEFENPVDVSQIRQELQAHGFNEPVVQQINEKRVIIKTRVLNETEVNELRNILTEKFGPYEELRSESIGPTIGRELVRKAYIQIVLVVLGILLYLAYAFRKIKGDETKQILSPWYLGFAAIIALIHDLIITIGFFAVLGKVSNVEIDNLFITALLTIAGFSVHDTIVVFDRIRENLKLYKYKPLSQLVDFSVSSTLARSINTSSTLVFVSVALLLFGGQTIFYFVTALLVGVIIGTYSSIFIAAPLLNLFQKRS